LDDYSNIKFIPILVGNEDERGAFGINYSLKSLEEDFGVLV
jgi:hypothetical protein